MSWQFPLPGSEEPVRRGRKRGRASVETPDKALNHVPRRQMQHNTDCHPDKHTCFINPFLVIHGGDSADVDQGGLSGMSSDTEQEAEFDLKAPVTPMPIWDGKKKTVAPSSSSATEWHKFVAKHMPTYKGRGIASRDAMRLIATAWHMKQSHSTGCAA